MADKKDNNREEIALEDREASGEKLYSPSSARNRDAIRDVLLEIFPKTGAILEIGGGTGEHAVHFARAMPGLIWRTGDPDDASRMSIAAWIAETGLANLQGPHAIDVTADDWAGMQSGENFAPFDGLLSITMIHIAPFAAAQGLFAGAQRYLRQDGALVLYGPFSRNGSHTAPSNEAFNTSLKARNPAWGVRDVEHDLAPLAQKHALQLERVVEMPANNLTLAFRKV